MATITYGLSSRHVTTNVLGCFGFTCGLEFGVVRKRLANGKFGRLETAPPWSVPFRCIAGIESPKYELEGLLPSIYLLAFHRNPALSYCPENRKLALHYQHDLGKISLHSLVLIRLKAFTIV